jgi:hypothetical protein
VELPIGAATDILFCKDLLTAAAAQPICADVNVSEIHSAFSSALYCAAKSGIRTKRPISDSEAIFMSSG